MTSTDIKWTGQKPLNKTEETVNVLDILDWTVQPPLGLIKGKYFREENWFAPHFAGDKGYHGVLEVVLTDGRLAHVEFNEECAPSYYKRLYQNVSKRRGSFCFYQATKARTAQTLKVFNNGICAVEAQMLTQNRLCGSFDLVSGASNSVKRSMLPLAAVIDARLVLSSEQPQYYYGYAEKTGVGITLRLELVLEANQIVSCSYDEIFADNPGEITDYALKKYHRQSKRYCLEFEPNYPDGFNAIFDRLESKVILTQDLFDLKGLPWTNDTVIRPHIDEWDRYLYCARILYEEMQEDCVVE